MLKIIAALLISILFSGCAALLPGPTGKAPVVMDTPVVMAIPNETIAPPKNGRKLIVGVYGCNDSTGQRKVTKSGNADMSSVVPQDCTPILTALLRGHPQHYRVLERGRIDNILKERQLAQAMYGDQTRSMIGNMLVADVLILGQIISYDRTSTQSAGGIAVNAIGAGYESISDTLTFSLDAISTKSGEILNGVLVKKTVESLQANGHILKIIGIDTGSIELGTAFNEPVGIALQQAVELAVQTLTRKGMEAGWWTD